MEETKRAFCEMCHARCRVVVRSENGRLIDVGEDRSYPLVDRIFPATRGCARLLGVKEWMYHPDRVNFPLKRARERGDGKWEKISWDEALDKIAARLEEIKQKYGAESLAVTTGTRRTRDFFGPFCHLFGTPNYLGQGTICYGPVIQTSAAMLGWPDRRPTSVGARGDATSQKTESGGCILLTGTDPSQSYLRLWKSVRDAKNAGCKIIVVDPRETQTTRIADLWLQLRPGTDTALLMSMVNVIIEEELYDKEFVERWCHGFDKVAERAREYPPDKASEITWVAADKIREAARMIGRNKPIYSFNGMGTEHLPNNIQAIQTRIIISAITGSIDVKGGHYLAGPARCRGETQMQMWGALSPDQKRKQLGRDRFRLQGWRGYDMVLEHILPYWGRPHAISGVAGNSHAPTVYRSMLSGKPYPVRAAITVHSNPMVTQANTKLVYKALKSLDLYVVADMWLTPSAELADYVLPTASWLERPFLFDGGNNNIVVGGEKALPSAIPGEYDHRTDYDIFRGLGMRLGQQQHWPWKDKEEVFNHMLEPMDTTFKQFMERGGFEFPPDEYKKHEKKGFATATGKVELYSTVLERLGYDPLPRYEEPFETPVSRPDLAKEYPLMLITGGRFLPMYHSEHRQVDSVRKRHPHPLVQINPDTARGLNVADGDWVWIESPRGRVRMKCQLYSGIDPRVVHAEHGWWFPELPGEEPWLHGVWESNVNVLIDDELDHCNQIGGGWPLRTALCKIYPVKKY